MGLGSLVGSAKLSIYIGKYMQTGFKKLHYWQGYKAHGRLQDMMWCETLQDTNVKKKKVKWAKIEKSLKYLKYAKIS